MTDRIQIIPELAEALGIEIARSCKACKYNNGNLRRGLNCGNDVLITFNPKAKNIDCFYFEHIDLITYKQLWELEEFILDSSVYKSIKPYKPNADYVEETKLNWAYGYDGVKETQYDDIFIFGKTREQTLQKLIVKLISEKVLSVEGIKQIIERG